MTTMSDVIRCFFFNDTATTEIYTTTHSFPTRRSSDLLRITQVISFFQRRSVFTPVEVPELGPLDVKKLIFELYSTNFTELNQLWGILGGKYVPPVVYKMRPCVIQDAPETPSPMVAAISLHSGHLTNPPHQPKPV